MTTLDRPKEPIIASAGGIPYNKPWLDYWRQRALAAEGALSSIPEQGVGVKALEWERHGRDWSAPSLVGRYEVGVVGRGFVATLRTIDEDGQWDDDVFGRDIANADEAKAAAQADYEARIRSALTSHPAAMAVTDEMVTEALKTFSRLCGVPWDKEPGDARDAMRDALEAARITQSVNAGKAVVVEPVLLTDGNASLPFQRDELGRMVREAWVRWAKTQPTPKPSWLVPYKELNEADKEADRQIGEAISRWTIVGIAARPAPPNAGVSELIQALEQIASYAGKTLISTEHGQPYSIGANAAFEEVAAIASAALVDRDRVK